MTERMERDVAKHLECFGYEVQKQSARLALRGAPAEKPAPVVN